MGGDDAGRGDKDEKKPQGASRDRDAILARRKFFIASALAGIAATSCDKDPKVCLNIAQPQREDAAAPMPCLEPPPKPQPEAQAEPTASASPTASTPVPDPTKPPEPSVCLKVAEPPKPAPRPRVCLKVAVPKDDD